MVTLKIDEARFRKQMDLTRQESQKIVTDAYSFFVSQTPIRTGNARNRTSLIGNTIMANYPYAKRLDDGYSRQSPEGMVGPTLDHIENKLIPEAVRRINNG